MMLNYRLSIKQSKIDGKGAFALEKIPLRKKIGNLGGKVISLREARQRSKTLKRVALVEFGNGSALDASIHSNQLRYVNHSCSPNTYIRVIHNRVEFLQPQKNRKRRRTYMQLRPHSSRWKVAMPVRR